MATPDPIPATATPADPSAAIAGPGYDMADMQLVEAAIDSFPNRAAMYRATRLLLIARGRTERLIIAIHILRGEPFEEIGRTVGGMTAARAKEIFDGLVYREARARKGIQRIRKILRREAKQSPERRGRRRSKALASSHDDAAIDAARPDRAAPDRRPGMSDTGDSGADFSPRQSKD